MKWVWNVQANEDLCERVLLTRAAKTVPRTFLNSQTILTLQISIQPQKVCRSCTRQRQRADDTKRLGF